MKIMELNIKEYEELVEMGLVKEEPRDIEVCGTWITKTEYDKLAHCEEEKKIPTLNDIRESYGLPRIEEKKIPEKLPKTVTDNACSSKDMRLIAITINQLIDYLKSKGE